MFRKASIQSNKHLDILVALYIKLIILPNSTNCFNASSVLKSDSQDNLEYINQNVTIVSNKEDLDRQFYDRLSKNIFFYIITYFIYIFLI